MKADLYIGSAYWQTVRVNDRHKLIRIEWMRPQSSTTKWNPNDHVDECVEYRVLTFKFTGKTGVDSATFHLWDV
jgi:hypothetical protein